MATTGGSGVIVTGLKLTEQRLRRLGSRARDLRPVLAGDIANELHKFFADQFATQGIAGGQMWQPLSPATVAFKARFGRAGMGPLQFTRQMWASLTKRSHPLGRRYVTAHSVEVGTNDPKAIKHQEGIGVPKRVIAPDSFPDGRLERWDRIIADYIVKEPTRAR